MAEKKLSVKLSLNDKQFQTGLRKATRSMKKFGKSMQKTGQTLSRSLTLPVLAFGAASVKAFDEQIKAETKLRTALKGNEQAFKNLKKQAQELQKVTLFGDEQTIEAQSMLAALGLTEEQIRLITPSLQDFASGMGVDLVNAASLVGKSIGTSTDALKRYLETGLKPGMTAQEKAITLTKSLTKAFGGQAQALAKEGLGPFQQLKNELGDVSEAFGKIILENIEPLKKALSSLAETLRELSTEKKESIVKWAGIAAVVGPLLIIIGKMVTAVGALGKALMWLNANPLVLVVSSIVALTAAVGYAIMDLDGFTRSAMKLGRVGKMVASGLLAVLGPLNPDMIAARTLLAMDFESVDSGGPTGTFEKIIPYAPTPTTPTTTPTTTTPTTTKKGATSFNINKHIPFLDELPKMKEFAENSLAINQSMADLGNIFPFVSEQAKTAFETMAEAVSPLESVFASFGSTLQHTFINAMQSQEGFFKSFAEGAKQALKALIAQIAAMSILTFLLGGTPLGGMMGAGSVGGMAGVKGLFGLASGGLATGPSLAMVGEGPGTSLSNPEVIAPLDQLKNYMGGGAVEVFGTLSGSDILLSSNRARNNRNRTSGY